MNTREALYGPNVGYALELYERYRQDPNSVDPATRAFFEQLPPLDDEDKAIATLARPSTAIPTNGRVTSTDTSALTAPVSVPMVEGNGAPATKARDTVSTALVDVGLIVRAARLARSIRQYGHLAADIDPLGEPRPGDPMLDPATHNLTDEILASLPASIVWPAAGPEVGTCLDAIQRLREIYCGHIGYEFDHLQNFEERAWLHQVVEAGTFRMSLPAERRRALLYRLSEVEGLEKFLQTKFVGQKRFSIEGTDTLVPMLDELVRSAAQVGTREVLIGMAHRGRLNVLAHVLGKPYAMIFSEFQAAPGRDMGPAEGVASGYGWTGDVKYHLGARKTVCEGDVVEVQLTLADNPSHLEFVDPVIEGFARAAQDSRDKPGAPRQDVDLALPVAIHGDASFPGEGIVAETLNLSRLPAYQTGGTVHIIVNNQIGFTTTTAEGRSTLYASDLAKGFEIPIVHVNADDPEACLAAIKLAHAYRNRFHRDFLVDLIGYRRWGHNEGDEPSFTQPRMYAKIAAHPTVRTIYAEQLVAAGVVSPEEVQAMQREIRDRLEQEYERMSNPAPEGTEFEAQNATAITVKSTHEPPTAVPADRLREMNEALLQFPAGFKPHPKLVRLIERRREMIEREGGIDWAHAEILAFASILADGIPIRLTGQDTARGTFSQRHLVLHNPETGATHQPLQMLPQARASFTVYNSPLSEASTLGFEYGYSIYAPDALVLWEAQFGDFANAAQVIIDQFIVAARAKWREQPALVLLLPHGYEGQGPEHSSARTERFLQLAAEDNVRIVNCTTSAQYFHILRQQAAALATDRRPLIIFTPKSLLRHPAAASSLRDLAEGRFQPVIDDASAADRRDAVKRLILCSGKIAVDLATTMSKRTDALDWLAVVRVEQLYPFPQEALERVIGSYPNLQEAVWLQEEPANMGAWSYMAPRLRPLLPPTVPLHYIGRPERASPAEGLIALHIKEQTRIIEEALEGKRPARIETLEFQDVD